MIDWISTWAQSIIIAVIIATIIEMILPSGSSKKYIKVVTGVYILFTIISPVITKFTGKTLAVSDILELDSYVNEIKQKEVSQNLLAENNSSSIKDIYTANLKSDIKNKLKQKGYSANNIVLTVGDDENYTLNKIEIYIEKIKEDKQEVNEIEAVNKINITISNTVVEKNNNKSSISDKEKEKIKQYLSSVYEIDEKDILVGNEKLMLEEKIDFKKCDEVGTILYVAIDKKYVGYVLIADKIKQDSPKTIRELKAMNIKETVMLTGDKKEVGEYVAKKLNMDKVYTELLPDGKVEKVEELLKQKSENGKLVFVGDGINDAPVLTISDIGVAMGGLGSDAAIEAADIVIMTDETSKISKAINLSKKTMRIVRENIIFAIFVKIAVLVLTAFGASTMWEAVFADVGVSVIAIINALRMLNIKKFE